MQTRPLRRSGLEVSALGFGCMGISFGYGQPTSREEGLVIAGGRGRRRHASTPGM